MQRVIIFFNSKYIVMKNFVGVDVSSTILDYYNSEADGLDQLPNETNSIKSFLLNFDAEHTAFVLEPNGNL